MLNDRNKKRIRLEIQEYFKEGGYSRVPSDYVEKWFLCNFKKPYPRRVIKLKIGNFDEMTEISCSVMDW